MEYRREVDGLRAVALLPVMMFHAGFETFAGGFVGVDVFFVISGYLITALIVAERRAGRFSFADFYERRMRRILPALYLVVVCCLPAAWYWMVPAELEAFRRSVAAVSLFASNILFWHESGYFDLGAEVKPLLHTWSLAVEEQYYVLFPLLVALFWRLGRGGVAAVLAAAFALSLGLAQWGSVHWPSAAFFLLPSRAWELLVGVALALEAARQRRRDTLSLPVCELLAIAGLAAIAFAVVAFDEQTPFPGLWALVPTLGAALVIRFATTQTSTGRILGHPLLVGIGLVSYSAYLWHQPLFAFARLATVEAVPRGLFVALIAVSFLLAWLSWRFVERPCRDRHRVSRRAIVAASVVLGLAMVALGGPAYLDAAANSSAGLAKTACEDFIPSAGGFCVKLGDGDRKIVVWGDSHADMFNYAEAAIPGYSMYLIGVPGCPPLIDIVRDDHGGNYGNCSSLATLRRYADYVRGLAPERIFLIARWHIYANGWSIRGVRQRESHFLSADETGQHDSAALSRRVLRDALGRTLRYFDGSRVIVIRQPPDFADYGVAGHLIRHDVVVARRDIDAAQQPEDAILAESVASNPSTALLDARSLFCDDRICRLRDADHCVLFRDDNHLSQCGVRVLLGAMQGYLD